MSRLLLLDGHSLAYRAFFALPAENFSTKTGQHTNAVYGFTSMLINVLRDEEPTHVAVAFDVSRDTFRSKEYADYKAGRSATPSEFSGQLPLLREVLDALKIRHIEMPGFEADDIIATLTTSATAAGMEVVICSGDRDAFQLVTDDVTLLYPVRGVSEVWRMDPARVLEKYGVPPERYSDLAALVGESSDNLPGIPGVGPKTAAKWITQYDGLTGIVAHVDQIGGKVGDALRANLEQVLRNRRLNQLVRDLDTGVSLADLERGMWDREKVHEVFDALEFRVLRERLFATFDTTAAEASEGGFEVETEVLSGPELEAWLAGPGRSGEIGVHVIGSWARGRGDVGAVALAAGAGPAGDVAVTELIPVAGAGRSGEIGVHVIGSWARGRGDVGAIALAAADGPAAYVDVTDLNPDAEAALGAWLADQEVPKFLHDAKGPLHALQARGWTLAGLRLDTALAAYLVKPDQRDFDLADLVVRMLGRDLRAQAGAADGMLDFGADDSAEIDAAGVRARAVLDLGQVLAEQVEKAGGSHLLRDVELPLVGVLAEMEDTGIGVDLEHLEALEKDFAQAVDLAQSDAYDAIGGEQINLGSPKQLQVVLFDTLGMPKTKRTKTGWTTDADALADLFAKTEHPFLEALLRHRDATRLRVTVEGLLKSVADDGRIHTTYEQTIAATGRLSSKDPNLQNIPIRTDEGRRIRESFVVGPGYESLMSVDYSQIEMRIMAHLSGDAGLIEAFRTGEDLHRFVGSRVFGVEPEAVTAAMRSKVKAMSYGLAYGLSAFGLSR